MRRVGLCVVVFAVALFTWSFHQVQVAHDLGALHRDNDGATLEPGHVGHPLGHADRQVGDRPSKRDPVLVLQNTIALRHGDALTARDSQEAADPNPTPNLPPQPHPVGRHDLDGGDLNAPDEGRHVAAEAVHIDPETDGRRAAAVALVERLAQPHDRPHDVPQDEHRNVVREGGFLGRSSHDRLVGDGDKPRPNSDARQAPVGGDQVEDEDRKRRLTVLAQLVRQFNTNAHSRTGLSSMSSQGREALRDNLTWIRSWLNSSAGISDALTMRPHSVLTVARMVLSKTHTNRGLNVYGLPLGELVRMAREDSYARIQEAVRHEHYLPDTDWLNDPVKWPRWSGKAPAKRRPNSTRPALVLPFHQGDIPRFDSFFARWGEIHLSGKYKKASAMAMVMAFNADLEHPDLLLYKKLILTLWRRYIDPNGRGPALYFLSLNQPSDLNHFDGAAASFYQLADYLPTYFNSMILMETDITPLKQQTWYSDLDDNHRPHIDCRYWVEGSASMCDPWEYGDIAVRKDYHINGNAIYAIGCSGFKDYLRKVRLFFPPQKHLKGCCCDVMGGCETFEREGFEYGYDHAMYQYRMQAENFMASRHIMSKFVYSHTILNHCEHSIHDFYGNLTIPADTIMVHSKYVLLSPEERIINEVTVELFGRKPWNNEFIEQYPLVKSGELSKNDYVALLCSQDEYQQSEIPVELCEGKDSGLPPWTARMVNKTYLWSVDFHSGPSHCNQHVFKAAGGVIHCETDYSLCTRHGMCPRRLRMLKLDNNLGFALKSATVSDPDSFVDRFHTLYQGHPEFQRVDAFICSHPVANCELFLPFKKPIIIYATTRLEFGRHDKFIDWRLSDWNQKEGLRRWNSWLGTMRSLAADPVNVIAANSLYDAKYIEYFTGIKAQLIPSWCGDQSDTMQRILNVKGGCQGDRLSDYAPYQKTILVGPYRTNLERTRFARQYETEMHHPLLQQLWRLGRKGGDGSGCFDLMSQRYNNGYYTSDLTSHRAIVFIPYQVSTIFTFEVYRLNIPLFFPDLKLLTTWWEKYDIMWERSYGDPEQPRSGKLAENLPSWPSPNANTAVSFAFWAKWCDWYQLPHIQLFSSLEDLMTQLDTANFTSISAAMRQQNAKDRASQIGIWKGIFDKIQEDKH